MTESSLKQKTIGALLWNLLDRMGQQVLLFIVGILVANILSVEDYALMGMLAIFTALASIVLDSGFGAALIRKQEASEADYATVFYFNVAVSLAVYALLFASAPLIAGFFGQPPLTDLTRVTFLALPLNALSLIQTTLLNKQIRFKELTKVNMVALTGSGLSSLVMAYVGCGVWTLAVQPVVLAGLRSVLLWRQNPWRPQGNFSTQSLRELFAFSSHLLLASLVNAIFTNIYSVVIGKLFPAVQLGLYTQGNKFSLMLISSMYSSLQSATYPIFARIQHDRERSVRSYRKTIRVTAFITFPVLVGAVVVAPEMIELLLKPAWMGCIPYFQLTALAGIFTILNTVNQNFAKVQGRSDLIFKMELLRTGLIVGCLALTWRMSALALVAGLVGVQLAVYAVGTVVIGYAVGYAWFRQLADVVPYAALSAGMWGMLQVPPLIISAPAALLPLKVALGVTVYYGLNRLLGSVILEEVRELWGKRKQKEI